MGWFILEGIRARRLNPSSNDTSLNWSTYIDMSLQSKGHMRMDSLVVWPLDYMGTTHLSYLHNFLALLPVSSSWESMGKLTMGKVTLSAYAEDGLEKREQKLGWDPNVYFQD
jgi:hypothetical protein